MFEETAKSGLDMQLVFYRGTCECQASCWVSNPDALANIMRQVECQTGHTRIGRIFAHIRKENLRQNVRAFVFVGDAVEEIPADLYAPARDVGVPGFCSKKAMIRL
jgi:hypothetical protein